MGHIVTAYAFRGLRKITPEQARKLTHLNIAFGLVKDDRIDTSRLTEMDYLADIRRANPDIKVLLSIGGWGAGGFSEAAATEQGRKLFAKTSAEACTQYGLDGIDVDWEYPTIGVAGIGFSPGDKQTFTLLLKEIRQELDRLPGDRRLLTIAAGADQYWVDGTEMDKAQEYLDLVQIMTYDMRGGFQTMTGHHTCLYPSSGDLFRISTATSVQMFIDAGVPREKIVIGAAFYGRKWTNVPNENNGLFRMTTGSGGSGGNFAELRANYINKNGYVRYWDDEACAPWLFNGDTFITYDDEQSIACKCDYLKEQGLAGIMYWEHTCDPDGILLGVMHEELNA